MSNWNLYTDICIYFLIPVFQFQLPDVDCAAVVAVAAFLLFLFCSFWLWHSSNARFHFSFTQATAKQAQKSNINTNLDTVMCAPLSLSHATSLRALSLSVWLAWSAQRQTNGRSLRRSRSAAAEMAAAAEGVQGGKTALNANIETMFI